MELSVTARTAFSYLDDIKRSCDALERIDNSYTRESRGLDLISGDLRLARKEAEGLTGDERDVVLAASSYREGQIYMAIAEGLSEHMILPEVKQRWRRYVADAGRAFESAAERNPLPLYLFDVGQAHRMLGNRYEAVQAFQKVIDDGTNEELAIEARKEIGRIGHVSPPSKPAASADHAPSTTGGSSFVKKKVVDGQKLKNGVIVAVVGLVLAGCAPVLGVPVLLIGIVMSGIAVAVGRTQD